MANRLLLAVIIGGVLAAGAGCGATDDESRLMPTPTQGPPPPTPLPVCQGLDIPLPPALGCRAFTWTQPEIGNVSGSQLFTTLPSPGGFSLLPSLINNGIDPGVNFVDVPPGLALLGGLEDPMTGVAKVTIGVSEEDQLEPGFVIIGMKAIIDYVCLKIELATVQGDLFCNGRDTQGIDTRITARSGITAQEDDLLEFPIGGTTAPGGLLLRVVQQQGRINEASDPRYETCFKLPECGPDERIDCYRPRQNVAFTTGTVFGMKGDTPLLSADGSEGISGEPFDCSKWQQTDGQGQLVQGFAELDESTATQIDAAAAFRIDD